MKFAVAFALFFSAAHAAVLRGAQPEGEGAAHGEGQPVALVNLDANPAATPSDYVLDVTSIQGNNVGLAGNRGQGGFIQAQDTGNGEAIALRGQGISLSHFTLNPGGENLPHFHPRATELLFVYEGELEVAFTDTRGVLCLNNMVAGQATLFPRALIHHQRNIGTTTARYISMLDSENPGVNSLPRTFVTLPDIALSNALRMSVDEVRTLKARVLPDNLNPGGILGQYDGAAGPSGNAPVPAFAQFGGLLEMVQKGEMSIQDAIKSVDVAEGKIGQFTYNEEVDGQPVTLDNLDFNPAATCSDFVFDVTMLEGNDVGLSGNAGRGGLVQAQDSGAGAIAMQGQKISLSHFTVQPGGTNLPHYHPRATELLFVYEGVIEVAFTDTGGNLIVNNVRAGQATVFPHALIHYQRNIGTVTARYISMLDSENPGVMSFPRTIWSLPTVALANAFRQTPEEIEAIQSRVLPPSLLAQPGTARAGLASNYDGAAGNSGNAPVPAFSNDPAVNAPIIPLGPGGGGSVAPGDVGAAVTAALDTTLQQAIVNGVVTSLNG